MWCSGLLPRSFRVEDYYSSGPGQSCDLAIITFQAFSTHLKTEQQVQQIDISHTETDRLKDRQTDTFIIQFSLTLRLLQQKVVGFSYQPTSDLAYRACCLPQLSICHSRTLSHVVQVEIGEG